MNHSSFDGNKRVALLSTVVFLKINGYNFNASSNEFAVFIIENIIKKSAELQQITSFIESHMVSKE